MKTVLTFINAFFDQLAVYGGMCAFVYFAFIAPKWVVVIAIVLSVLIAILECSK